LAPSASPRKVETVKWLHGSTTIQLNAVFPILLAKDHGFAKQQDIDITEDYAQGATSFRLIGVGQYNAGSAADVASVVNLVSQGLPVKAVAQLTQNGGRAFAVLKNSGITRPKDFEGRKVGIKNNAASTEYLAMLAYDHVDRSKIQELNVGLSSVELVQKTVDVLPVFTNNEPNVLTTQLGADITILYPRDFGFSAVGTPVMVNLDWAKANRDIVVRFLKAVLKSEEYMVANRDDTIATGVKLVPNFTRDQDTFSYDATVKDMVGGTAALKGVGWLDTSQWQNNVDVLLQLGVIKQKPNVEDLVDTSFLTEVLKDGKVIWP
jgi:ABC-type nitrate/sulfonate/bicarbonate transport system substrate-binding protein